jgi:branched-chain amino acid transport system substrate-binding protein
VNSTRAIPSTRANRSRSGIDGRRIELIFEDDQGNPNLTVLRTQKLVDRGAQAILLTSTSAAAIQARAVCEKRKVPCISPANVSPDIVAPPNNGFIFSIAPPITLSAAEIGKAFNALGFQTAAFYLAEDPNQAVLMELFADALTEAGVDVVARETMPHGATDNTPQLVRLKEKDPDAVIDLSATDSAIAQFYQGAARVGLDASLWDSPNLRGRPEAWKIAGPTLDGAHVMDSFDPTNPNLQALDKALKEQHPDMDMTVIMAETGDALMLLKGAIESAGTTDGTAVRDAIRTISEFPAAHGPSGYGMTFTPDDHNGASPSALVVLEFNDGRPEPWDEYQPSGR